MKDATNTPASIDDYRTLDAELLVALLAERDAELTKKNTQLEAAEAQLDASKNQVKEQKHYILLLEEYLRLAKARRFGASSEKCSGQIHLFDEAELEVALAELEPQISEEDRLTRSPKKNRHRSFGDDLKRVRVELALTDEEKAGRFESFQFLESVPQHSLVLDNCRFGCCFRSSLRAQ